MPFTRFAPHSIQDRAWWSAARAEPRHAAFWVGIEKVCADAPARPTMPSATDFLAARRSNDRGRLDRHWRETRRVFSALALRRCALGLDENDSDDRLLDWLFAFLTEPTWAASAHLPEKDLPASAQPTLDLAACEMAAQFAELRECLKPWLDSVSKTLADSMLWELDRRVLTPYAEGVEVWWQKEDGFLNNWTGVCCGSILAACESLAAQGQPRPRARERALAGLRLFLDKGFTPHGECDEGAGYWNYGLGFACLGWQRLTAEEFAAQADPARLRLVADYPRLTHLFGDHFFTGNDGGLRANAARFFVPWLAAVLDDPFLGDWACRYPSAEGWLFSQYIRLLAAPNPADLRRTATPVAPPRAVFLPDQQVAILRAPTPKGELLACLTGGTNAERHNHNDLGHFLVALDGQVIIPDLGAPLYFSDFFGPKRYSYVSASSRGHCCPLIGEHEQRVGPEAAGKVLSWTSEGEIPRLVLDLTSAYPEEAGLLSWTRSLECWPAARLEEDQPGTGALFGRERPARMVITDVFRTRAPNQKIIHRLWSLESFLEPDERVEGTGFRLKLGSLFCEVSPAPFALDRTALAPAELHLRDYQGRTLQRVDAVYRTDAKCELKVETRFFAL